MDAPLEFVKSDVLVSLTVVSILVLMDAPLEFLMRTIHNSVGIVSILVLMDAPLESSEALWEAHH